MQSNCYGITLSPTSQLYVSLSSFWLASNTSWTCVFSLVVDIDWGCCVSLTSYIQFIRAQTPRIHVLHVRHHRWHFPNPKRHCRLLPCSVRRNIRHYTTVGLLSIFVDVAEIVVVIVFIACMFLVLSCTHVNPWNSARIDRRTKVLTAVLVLIQVSV